MTRSLSLSFVKEIVTFGVVGSIGFVVDTAVLYLLKGHIGLFYGRAASFVAAAVTTWLINRSWTFRDKRSSLDLKSEFTAYFLLMLIGGAVNYAVYATIISKYTLAARNPIIGVAVGSIAGMFVNLATSRTLLFKSRQPSTPLAER